VRVPAQPGEQAEEPIGVEDREFVREPGTAIVAGVAALVERVGVEVPTKSATARTDFAR
jgi:hypothetical protein